MKSTIFKNWDWAKFDPRNAEHRKMLSARMQYFCALPDRFVPDRFTKVQEFIDDRAAYSAEHAAMIRAKIQEFTTTGDFPTSILPVIEKFHATPHYDTAYEDIFDIRDFSASRRNGFEMTDVTSGLTFEIIPNAKKAKVYQMSGTKQTVYFHKYAGALNWDRQLFDDAEYWTIEDNAIAFRNAAYSHRSSVYYALLEAAADAKSCISLTDPGCDDNLCSKTAVAWATALNTAAQTILLAVRNKGYGVTPQNAVFKVVTPIQLTGLMRQALDVNLQAFSGSERHINYRFDIVSTMMLTDTSRVLVVLPKIKLKGGYRMDLTIFSDFDILSYVDTEAGWMRFGGAIGDTDQIECIDSTLPSGF